MSTPQSDVFRYRCRIDDAIREINNHRRIVCTDLNAKHRRLKKHLDEVVARQADGQLDLDLSALQPSPEIMKLLNDPIGASVEV